MENEIIKRRPRHFGHKVALGVAAFGVLGALGMAGVSAWLWFNLGPKNTWTASAFAGVGFFACIAWVCQAMSVPQPLLEPEEKA